MNNKHTEKDNNFVSAVAYVKNNENDVFNFLKIINSELSNNFLHYEIIMVNDASFDASEQQIKTFAAQNSAPITLISMSIGQGAELCMNAGVDAAIGDFVFEFDTLNAQFDPSLLLETYKELLKGYDIVSVGPKKNRNIVSGLFYKILQSSSQSKNKFQTEAFRLLSRRAINRVRAVTATPVYRKAAYATCGLNAHTITHESVIPPQKGESSMRLSLAVNSLALYSNFAYKFSFGVAVAMLLGMFSVLVYIFIVFFGQITPVEGWTTTMLAITSGFFGVFVILTIILKYLSLLVDIIVKQQKYLVEKVEKL